jgi:hypothetical protein
MVLEELIGVGEIHPWYAFVSGLERLITYFYPLLVNSFILNTKLL